MPKIYDYEQNSKGEYVLKGVRNLDQRRKKRRLSKLEINLFNFVNGFAVGSFYVDRVKQLLRTCGLDV